MINFLCTAVTGVFLLTLRSSGAAQAVSELPSFDAGSEGTAVAGAAGIHYAKMLTEIQRYGIVALVTY